MVLKMVITVIIITSSFTCGQPRNRLVRTSLSSYDAPLYTWPQSRPAYFPAPDFARTAPTYGLPTTTPSSPISPTPTTTPQPPPESPETMTTTPPTPPTTPQPPPESPATTTTPPTPTTTPQPPATTTPSPPLPSPSKPTFPSTSNLSSPPPPPPPTPLTRQYTFPLMNYRYIPAEQYGLPPARFRHFLV